MTPRNQNLKLRAMMMVVVMRMTLMMTPVISQIYKVILNKQVNWTE